MLLPEDDVPGVVVVDGGVEAGGGLEEDEEDQSGRHGRELAELRLVWQPVDVHEAPGGSEARHGEIDLQEELERVEREEQILTGSCGVLVETQQEELRAERDHAPDQLMRVSSIPRCISVT